MHSQSLTMEEPVARLDGRGRGLMHGGLGQDLQIVGDHAPADPSFHPVGAMIPAAIQFVAPFQPTDPTLDAGAPVVATPEPPLLLIRQPFGRLGPRLGPHHPLDAPPSGLALVRGGMETAIPGQQPGRVLE